MPKKFKIKVVLVGNPNTGKSTLFNALTGVRQHVGNWPGKTVEKKEGILEYKGRTIKIIDLPGTYSLTAYTEEEAITARFINGTKPNVVVQIIDAQNLERNLFMTVQLIESGAPLILAINMLDLTQKENIQIDTKKLSILLGIPVVPISAKQKKGIENLMQTIVGYFENPPTSFLKLKYGTKIESETKKRYDLVKNLSKEVLSSPTLQGDNTSDKIDKILLNKFLGIPIFLVITWLMFQATFKLSKPLINWIETLFALLAKESFLILDKIGALKWTQSLIVDGIIGGVGGVLVFIPIIGTLFLLIALLEDSGYMARIAYLMDNFMQKLGLHGKAFIPLIIGFGCNVPGIMATRTLATKRDRLLTILINPFISCGARLPVYALFAGAFFSSYQGLIVFSMYLLGIFIAILAGLIFKKILLKTTSSPFVIELPPYRYPALQGILLHAWGKIWLFIKKAGTIILAFSIIIWLMSSLPVGVDYGSNKSLAGKMGEIASPIFEPLGFGNWESSVALLFGLAGKEIIVSTFGTLYGVNIENTQSVSQALKDNFTPLSAYAFMVFVSLYVPCLPTIAIIKRELNSWKWAIFVIFYTTAVAWIMAFIVYQGGSLLGFN
ncbi:MAG: bifunctional ferrous iron transporter, protein b/GTP-binding protein/membrane protein, ferrous iron transport protein B [Candidatus Peregrinibacteria bacterium GW2011_GWE2_39_6]|nr:MAG: bifunctional ferrous iron transporter, protein b/GTP-binding protein/membrane protein, ferrous iron transport protein B [Candidatus Peregrinibacteria bacterium GW2011_GWF2_39_17]KKR24191.1 MAG: bifunctional ferrous iron transporter, protein b/GTP-binding protein/membrane protein, ferrous iron transport protein B [Candidatus Peregrinibacteria bacterium GW2011_GWE2_39_6]HCW32098.1 ferrous iron transport protein B [Candidatus Peregrinibacteria bacterium]